MWLLVLLAVLFGASAGLAEDVVDDAVQHHAFGHYAHASWTSRDGLPQDAVYSIVETPEGYLWIGTAGGLARFDGVRFTVFDRSNTPELHSNYVRRVVLDRDQNLWIGTDGGGVTRYRNGRFEHLGLDEGIPHARVISLAADPRGGLWIGTYGGGVAHRRVEGSVHPIDPSSGLIDRAIFGLLAEDDGLWVGTQSQGALRLENGEVTVALGEADGLPATLVYDFVRDEHGAVWIATAAGLARYDGNAVEVFGTDHGLPFAILSSATITRSGDLWIGTSEGGVARRHGDRFERFDQRSGLSADSVRDVFQDSHGQIWLGTGRGLDRLTTGPLTNYLSGTTTAFVEAADGTLWIGSFGGLTKLAPDGSVLARLGPDDGLVDIVIWHAVLDADDRLWIATSRGAQQIDPTTSTVIETWTAANGLPSVGAFFLQPAADGGLWIGTGAGVAKWREGRVEGLATGPDLCGGHVRSLFEEPSGALWVGTTDGLCRLRPNAAGGLDPGSRRFGIADGLPNPMAWALRESPNGELWIATRGGGLARFRDGSDGGRFDTVDMSRGLPDDTLCSLWFDDHGDTWIGASKGVFRVDFEQLEAVANGQVDRLFADLFDTSDGMQDTLCSSVSPVDPTSRDGRLWFPTYGGVAVIDPSRLAVERGRPRPKIEAVLVDGDARSMAPPIELAHDERDLEIRYTALGFREPRRLRFRYRMTPTETAWHDVGARRTAYFSRLPPGEHVFELSVGTAAGRWQEPVSIAFTIRPAFHQTRLFAGLASIVLVALGLFLSRFLYLQRHTWTLRRMQKEITDKNAELAAQNVELERFAQSVAHDLKNPLHTIQGFLDLLEMDLDGGRLDAIESGIEQIRDGTEALDQRLDALLELSRAGRVVGEPRRVDLAAVVARTIRHLGAAIHERGVVVDVAPLAHAPAAHGDPDRLAVVFQNLIENAIKYSGDVIEPRIEVEARQRGDRVRCRVRDNGIGIAPEHLGEVFGLFRQLDPRADGSGIGLALVRRVIEAHGGKVRVRSDGVGQGTSFVFDLPAAEPTDGTFSSL